MESMRDVYDGLVEQDLVKEAEAQVGEQLGADMSGVDPELMKTAQEYDYIGRVLAHNAFTDLVKEALEEEMAGAPEEDKKEALSDILAKAKGEKKDEKKPKAKGEGDETDKEESEEDAEKKASIREAVLDKMANDPEYAAYLAAKYLSEG